MGGSLREKDDRYHFNFYTSLEEKQRWDFHSGWRKELKKTEREPPPKVELKKIPTTRSKSPKLGRRKSSGDATGGETGPRVTKPNDSSSFILKKPITKPQPKVETQEKSGKAEERRKEVKKEEAKKKRRLRS